MATLASQIAMKNKNTTPSPQRGSKDPTVDRF